VEFENLPSGIAAWLYIEDKYNLPMFNPYNYVGIKLKHKPNSGRMLIVAYRSHHIAKRIDERIHFHFTN
jgi:hypothetical protein